ncbi:nucleotidyltransferase family protein [Derxia lacustris]|uniref:nucleotidyltransferase family protein n=1 Tax=Derxia lacustris TaxID=764842 RepID=UPI000A1743F8|nr:nucleotidyltransferase family protein [Derxia lacustris]
MKAVVLAGGFGTRLRERVADLPKPMAPIAGRPFLEYLLDRLAAAHFSEVLLSVGYLAKRIEAHFGNCYRGMTLRYSVEAEPLGTGGAIALALADCPDEAVVVLNGDTFVELDFADFLAAYAAAPEDAFVALRQVDDVARFGEVVVEDGRATRFSEKGRSGPGWINAGIYVLRSRVFARHGLAGRFSLESDLLQAHCAELRPRVFRTDGYFIDIGIPAEFDRAQTELPALGR